MAAQVSAASASAAATVTTALKRASEATGAGYDFLKAMAARESSLNASAKAATSSAAGLFQFIDQTWLGAVKQYGARHGLADYADDISRGADGKFTVADDKRRAEILDLRFDPEASASLAGELANENQSLLERRLGRAATSADLYTAHFLGPVGAVKLLSAASSVKAADILPAAAKANEAVFYDGARAKTVGEVVASIAKSMGAAARGVANDASTVSVATGAASGGFSDAAASASAPAMTARAATYNHDTDYVVAPRRATLSASTTRLLTDGGVADYFSGGGRLSAIAWKALQSLDPTRLSGHRDDRA